MLLSELISKLIFQLVRSANKNPLRRELEGIGLGERAEGNDARRKSWGGKLGSGEFPSTAHQLMSKHPRNQWMPRTKGLATAESSRASQRKAQTSPYQRLLLVTGPSWQERQTAQLEGYEGSWFFQAWVLSVLGSSAVL